MTLLRKLTANNESLQLLLYTCRSASGEILIPNLLLLEKPIEAAQLQYFHFYKS